MVRPIGRSICALALFAGTSSAAADGVIAGTVSRVDERTGVIVLEDGRSVQATQDVIVLVDDRPSRLSAVEPGNRVVVVSPRDARDPGPVGSGHVGGTTGRRMPEMEFQAP